MPNRKQFPVKLLRSGLVKSIVLTVLVCLPLTATLYDYGVTSDEPIYMEAAWNIQKWLALDLRKIINQDEIDRYWKTDPRRNVHPSGLKWLYLLAQKIIFWENDPYRQNGVLNVLIFSISIIILFNWWNGKSIGRSVVSIVLLLTMPRFFAHTHFPVTDIFMTSLLLFLVVFMDRTLFRKNYWLVGFILGFFVSIKITSILLILPVLFVFLVWYRDKWKTALPRIALICLISLFVFYVLNPDYWFSPLSRSREFFTQSLTRRSWTPFTVYFGGRFYSYRGPLYYPFTMFFITTPLLHMLLLILGLRSIFMKRRLKVDLKIVLVFTCLVFPFLILTMPMSPAHDGIRYLLPAFPFAVCFMTRGLEKLWNFVRDQSGVHPIKTVARWIAAAATMALLAGDLHNPARYPPFELSYYNRIVGGLSGAYKRGYETTYFWEILNDDILNQLNKRCTGSFVYFPLTPTDIFFKHMLRFRKIDFLPTRDPQRAEFMLIIGRPFIRFWESRTYPVYRKEGKIPIPIWDISLDSVPLLKLYRITGEKR